MFGNYGLIILLLCSWFIAWRLYVWAKDEERRADRLEARLLVRYAASTKMGGDDAS